MTLTKRTWNLLGRPVRPTRLQTEFAAESVTIDPAKPPRFGWTLPAAGDQQIAYRLQLIHRDGGFDDPQWDTGRLDSSDSVGVVCDASLEARTSYRWRVKVWTSDGTESEWSKPAAFECGLATDEWEATAIAAPPTDAPIDPAPALRTSFEVDGDVERARLYVATGGTHVIRMNGTRIGDRQLDPAFTDYEERTLYATHDVTAALRSGENVLGFLLGRDRYAMATESVWAWQQAPWHEDRPNVTAQLEIEYANGETMRVLTGDGWEARGSATRFDSIFAGERYDARAALENWTLPGMSDTNGAWSNVECVDGPVGEFVPQVMQPMRAVDTVLPVEISEPADGVYVFDFGEMIAGWTQLTVDAPTGTELTLVHAEKLDEDGFVDVMQGHVEAQLQTDEYVCAGDGVETWAPQFSYRGFRFVQVEGLPEPPDPELLTGVSVHSNIEAGWDSDFDCDDDLLTRIHANARRGLLNNVHGIPTDSPTYEKNGWTGDVQVTAEAILYNFDAARFYEKWLDDCADAQQADGELPPIVPTSDWGYEGSPIGGMSGPFPGWDGAYIFLPWSMYRHFGDRGVLERHYDGMRRLVEFYEDRAEAFVIEVGLGDWLPPGSGITADTMKPPEGPAITSTAYFYRMAEVVAETATVLGRHEDADRYANLADEIGTAFHERFWDTDRGCYRTGETEAYRQTSNVFPLAFGIVPESNERQVVDRLVEDVMETHDGHLNTGFHGTKYLLPTLAAYGHVDVAYEIASRDTHPSWGYWIVENDATALYESWELHSRSRDHPSYGSIDAFFYGTLAGITPAEPGYQRVRIRPHLPEALNAAGATVETVRGIVASVWERTDDGVRLEVRIPGNATGKVYVPESEPALRSDGEVAAEVAPVRVEDFAEGSVWEVPPGDWSFVPE